MLGRIGGAAVAHGLIAILPATLAQAQPIPAPREGKTPEFPSTAERSPAVERRASDRPELKNSQVDEPAMAPAQERQPNADPCAGDPACYQRQDLQAQEDMAIAAFWMTVATWVQVGIAVIGTVVALVGTILLLRSLRYSRMATEAATSAAAASVDANTLNRQVFVAEQRAWLALKSVSITRPSHG
jgi:hypothetical protein